MLSFDHQFEDAAGNVTNGAVHLTVQQIEDAGVLEILQTPGAVLGHWQFLDALLDSSVTSFSFLQPLGHAREVKTAISGLFGRFVARAYATRHLGLTHFVHVRKPPMRLSGPMLGQLSRVPGRRGDMPDWAAWGAGVGMAIVEAKGCHDSKSPRASLDRAFVQAERAEIRGRRGILPFKRYAIATRWGFTSPKIWAPMLWVKDPPENGEITDDERDELEVAMARWHIATLLRPLGLEGISATLLNLATNPFRNRIQGMQVAAREALSSVPPVLVERDAPAPEDTLIGGFVTRAGPLGAKLLTSDQQATLRDIGLRPSFVGVEWSAINRAIEGIPSSRMDEKPAIGERRDGEDGAGAWIIRLDEKATTLSPLARLT